ncbi:uncharacterized protein LOC132875033 isoform X2 [Neoarius graeffei]|uniref:uncharacterized protein LOC132875033 isoform X2 n=1 Tax=Neoarius graeffei TaxID=443677 RepID=UPI00298C7797|nr:uncharacterized protein LOC132875033 isoform X2 [Neoarius graeffei]
MNASPLFLYRIYQLLAFVLVIHKVSGQITTVEAAIGDSVILSCSASRYETDVFWRYDNTKTVYDIINGKENFHDQDSAYSGRVEGFQSEFTKGNYSIRLSDVKHTDAGIYSCQIPGSRTLQVELKVQERKDSSKSTSESGNSGVVTRPAQPQGMMVYIAWLVTIGCILLLTMHYGIL